MERYKRLPDSELEIMMCVWEAPGPVTSAWLCQALEGQRSWAVTTVLNFLARLVEKGYLSVQREGKTNLYTPLVSREEYIRQEGRSPLGRLYGHSIKTLVASLFDSQAIGEKELQELRRFIDEQAQKQEEDAEGGSRP